MNQRVRQSLPSDEPRISAVLHAAFGSDQGDEITELVFDLLADRSAQPVVSLVTEIERQVVGYVLFTRARIEAPNGTVPAAILAPLAVHPDHQGRGLGGQLVRRGLEQSRTAGYDLAFVLGHPGYYSRHGFVGAGTHGFAAPYAIPSEHAEAWRVQELRPGILGKVGGRVACADSLMDPKHWRE